MCHNAGKRGRSPVLCAAQRSESRKGQPGHSSIRGGWQWLGIRERAGTGDLGWIFSKKARGAVRQRPRAKEPVCTVKKGDFHMLISLEKIPQPVRFYYLVQGWVESAEG